MTDEERQLCVDNALMSAKKILEDAFGEEVAVALFAQCVSEERTHCVSNLDEEGITIMVRGFLKHQACEL